MYKLEHLNSYKVILQPKSNAELFSSLTIYFWIYAYKDEHTSYVLIHGLKDEKTLTRKG